MKESGCSQLAAPVPPNLLLVLNPLGERTHWSRVSVLPYQQLHVYPAFSLNTFFFMPDRKRGTCISGLFLLWSINKTDTPAQLSSSPEPLTSIPTQPRCQLSHPTHNHLPNPPHPSEYLPGPTRRAQASHILVLKSRTHRDRQIYTKYFKRRVSSPALYPIIPAL